MQKIETIASSMNFPIGDMNIIAKTFERPAIAHLVRSYLLVTQNWIYTQLINMKSFKPFVLTKELENREAFPFEDIFYHRPPLSGHHFWQIASKKVIEALFHAHEKYCINVIRTKQTRLLHAHFGTEGYYYLGVQRKVDIL